MEFAAGQEMVGMVYTKGETLRTIQLKSFMALATLAAKECMCLFQESPKRMPPIKLEGRQRFDQIRLLHFMIFGWPAMQCQPKEHPLCCGGQPTNHTDEDRMWIPKHKYYFSLLMLRSCTLYNEVPKMLSNIMVSFKGHVIERMLLSQYYEWDCATWFWIKYIAFNCLCIETVKIHFFIRTFL
mmetsp:Transcript_3117/g.6901  ORF Transcript_3117/g.6901 Transcript_3117/m.6901 type:complete len:183 (+) Transcript_3117:4078-4626(+)